MKKVVLTGGTGLIGKYAIQPLLDAGFEIFAISSKEIPQQKKVNWIKADLLDFSSIKTLFEKVKPQYLLHFAWDTTPGIYLESNLNFDFVLASMETLKQFKLQGGKRAVYAGTCFEYEFTDEPLKEYGKLNPTSTYAKCKNYLNGLATLYSEKNDINFGWGRIFYAYGEDENERRLTSQVISSLNQNKEFTTSAGELNRDYMFAEDIAGAFVKFLNSDVAGCVNICTGKSIKIKDIVTLVAKKLKKEHLVKFNVGDLSQPRFIFGDTKRLKEEVGFVPRYSLEQGIDKILENYNKINSGK